MDATGNKEATHVDHVVKRRAGAACIRCRTRKVRCDLTSHGSPCTNCSLDRVPCLTRPSRRQKYGPISNLELVSQNEFLSTDGQNLGSQMIHQIGLETRTSPLSTFNRNDQSPTDPGVETPEIPGNNPSQTIPHNGGSTASSLPRHFRPPPPSMIAEDVEHLSTIGVFSMPSNTLRGALLQSFLDYVHPLNAVLDLQDLLAMEGLAGDGTVSLLVFYTVMLGGSLFVDMKHLTDAGFTTRRAARQSFYRKSKAIYEADYEQDNLCIAQALSLLSLWWETSGGHKNCWYWSGLAINLLHLVFLDIRRDEAKAGPKLAGKWKRLWWSCYIRDRIIGLGMKLPMRLNVADYGMEILELEDFNLDGATACYLSFKETTKLSWCREKFRGLYTLCMEESKLCICIDRLICVGRIEPIKLESKIRELQVCESRLQDWRSQLPDVAALNPNLNITAESNLTLTLHHAALRMMSYCVSAFIQRTYLILNLPDSEPLSASIREMQNSARINIDSTATTMTKIVEELQELGLIRYLPHSAVFGFVLVALMYLLDLTAVNGIEGISQSMRMMDVFRDSYFDTSYMSHTVNLVFNRESIKPISHSGQYTLSGPNTSSSLSTPDGHNISYNSSLHGSELGHSAETLNPLNPMSLDQQTNDLNVVIPHSSQNNSQGAFDGSFNADSLNNFDTSLPRDGVNIDNLLMQWPSSVDWNFDPLPGDTEMTP